MRRIAENAYTCATLFGEPFSTKGRVPMLNLDSRIICAPLLHTLSWSSVASRVFRECMLHVSCAMLGSLGSRSWRACSAGCRVEVAVCVVVVVVSSRLRVRLRERCAPLPPLRSLRATTGRAPHPQAHTCLARGTARSPRRLRACEPSPDR